MKKAFTTQRVVTLVAWISRIVTAAIQIFAIRVLNQCLPAPEFAAITLLIGLAAWLQFSDLGLGAASQNCMSEKKAQGISSDGLQALAVAIAFIIGLLLLFTLQANSDVIADLTLRNFPEINDEIKSRAIFSWALAGIVSGLGTIAYKMWYAEGKGYWSNIFPALGALSGLIAVKIYAAMTANPNLPMVIAVYQGPTAVLGLVSLVFRLRTASAIKTIQPAQVWQLFSRSMNFFGLSVVAALVLQVDFIMLARYSPPNEIVVYGLVAKVLNFGFFLFTAALTAAWPVITEAAQAGQYQQIRKMVLFYQICGVTGMILVSALLWMSKNLISSVLLPELNSVLPTGLIALYGLYLAVRCIPEPCSICFQSLSIFGIQWKAVIAHAIVNISLQLLLAPLWGIYGVASALLASFILTTVWGYPMMLSRILRRLEVEKRSRVFS